MPAKKKTAAKHTKATSNPTRVAKANSLTSRAKAPLSIEFKGLTPPVGTTSACYIRSFIMRGGMTTEAILAAVHKNFPEGKAAQSDVFWNRSKLKREGATVPEITK